MTTDTRSIDVLCSPNAFRKVSIRMTSLVIIGLFVLTFAILNMVEKGSWD